MSIDEQHGPTVSYWQAIALNAQAEAKQRLDEWCVLKDEATDLQRQLAQAREVLREQRRQMDFPDIPYVFAETMRRMLDKALK